MVREVTDLLENIFKSLKEAFIYFTQDNKLISEITEASFTKAISGLCPDRFISSDIEDLWEILS